MSAYHGGKKRIGKTLANIIYEESMDIEDEYDFDIKGYCEPFSGMLGVFEYIPELFKDHKPKLKYKLGDINKSVVKMWNSAKKGWNPPTDVTKTQFEELKTDGKTSDIKGFVGHAYTFRGVFFDGYFKHSQRRINSNAEKVKKIGSVLKKSNASITAGSYKRFSNLKGYVIYCDPPYEGGEQRYYTGVTYSNRLVFDNNEFWNWCIEMAKDNIVFVSEYKAPRNIEKIWSSGKEKLYILY